ncbi:VanZ family protein [Clostridium ihumii]|uniref:VanZ family protein n=1 Tax=Clostridium ihumii TaxID=1470356 RepID=UPI000686AD29|nr:VanZ family protein [Clostridium ihumii]
MGYILEALAEYVFMLSIFIVIEIIICFYYKKKGVVIKKGFIIGWQLLACLMTMIFSITGASGISDIGNHGKAIIRLDEINLIPIIKWGIGDLFGVIMNIIMFIPFGIGIPLLWKNRTTFVRTTFVGFVFSLLIEISQLFNFRATDIDDLIMNTLGTMIGYGIYYLLLRKITIFQMDNSNKKKVLKNTALINVVTIFGTYFFIGNSIINLIWRSIYKY